MLEEAASLAEEGKAVYVMCNDMVHAEILHDKLDKDWDKLGVKFETPLTVPGFDWKRMTIEGAHPNVVVLVDHYTIESRFRHMLDMLHRYDPEE